MYTVSSVGHLKVMEKNINEKVTKVTKLSYTSRVPPEAPKSVNFSRIHDDTAEVSILPSRGVTSDFWPTARKSKGSHVLSFETFFIQ